jgi:hypothetical protein
LGKGATSGWLACAQPAFHVAYLAPGRFTARLDLSLKVRRCTLSCQTRLVSNTGAALARLFPVLQALRGNAWTEFRDEASRDGAGDQATQVRKRTAAHATNLETTGQFVEQGLCLTLAVA